MIGGYDHKQSVLLEKIMDRIVNFKIQPKRFEILKENVRIIANILAVLIKIC